MNSVKLAQLPVIESMYKNGVPLRDLVNFMSTDKMSARNLDYFKNDMVGNTFIYAGKDNLGWRLVREFPEFEWYYKKGPNDGMRIPKKVIDANVNNDEIAEDEEYWINGVMVTNLTKKQITDLEKLLQDENFTKPYKGYERYKIGIHNNLKTVRL